MGNVKDMLVEAFVQLISINCKLAHTYFCMLTVCRDSRTRELSFYHEETDMDILMCNHESSHKLKTT